MKIYKMMECHNEDGRHVCGGQNCMMSSYISEKHYDEAIEWTKEKHCAIICRCVQEIEVRD